MPSPPAAASAAAPHPPIEERAAAKLNLDLLVTGRRGDGYHLLDSLVVFLDLADVLRLGPAPALELQVTGPMAGDLDAGEGNLALKAARALAARAGVAAGARLTLEKRLPVAAGIGGGSADAAAALRGLARLWGVELTAGEVAGLALRLGADVPACLFGRPLRLRGIGESLEPLAGVPPLDLVLANPKRPLATADVFRALDRAPVGPERPEGGDLVAALAASRNDLEPAAARLMPEVADVLRELAAEPGCALARMSGSGPTCFGLFPDAAAAQAAAARLAARRPGWWVAASRSGGSPRAP